MTNPYYDIMNPLYNAYKQTVPSNMRLLAKSIVHPTPVTENNFTPKELNILRKTAANAASRGGSYIGYPDYPHPKTIIPIKGDDTPIRSSVLSPAYAMATTIGKAKVNQQPNGTHISDNYNFGEISPQYQAEFNKLSPVYQGAEYAGNYLGHQMPVDINLGKINPYK